MSHAVPSPRISTTDNKQRTTGKGQPHPQSSLSVTWSWHLCVLLLLCECPCPCVVHLSIHSPCHRLPLRAYPLLGQTITFMQHSMLDCYVFFCPSLSLCLFTSLAFIFSIRIHAWGTFLSCSQLLPAACLDPVATVDFVHCYCNFSNLWHVLCNGLGKWRLVSTSALFVDAAVCVFFSVFFFIDNFLQVFIMTNWANGLCC